MQSLSARVLAFVAAMGLTAATACKDFEDTPIKGSLAEVTGRLESGAARILEDKSFEQSGRLIYLGKLGSVIEIMPKVEGRSHRLVSSTTSGHVFETADNEAGGDVDLTILGQTGILLATNTPTIKEEYLHPLDFGNFLFAINDGGVKRLQIYSSESDTVRDAFPGAISEEYVFSEEDRVTFVLAQYSDGDRIHLLFQNTNGVEHDLVVEAPGSVDEVLPISNYHSIAYRKGDTFFVKHREEATAKSFGPSPKMHSISPTGIDAVVEDEQGKFWHLDALTGAVHYIDIASFNGSTPTGTSVHLASSKSVLIETTHVPLTYDFRDKTLTDTITGSVLGSIAEARIVEATNGDAFIELTTDAGTKVVQYNGTFQESVDLFSEYVQASIAKSKNGRAAIIAEKADGTIDLYSSKAWTTLQDTIVEGVDPNDVRVEAIADFAIAYSIKTPEGRDLYMHSPSGTIISGGEVIDTSRKLVASIPEDRLPVQVPYLGFARLTYTLGDGDNKKGYFFDLRTMQLEVPIIWRVRE